MARKRRGRGEGGIYQRADGVWVGAASLGYTAAGKRRRKTVYGATKEEVQKKLRELQVAADAGTLSDASRLSVGDYLARWLEHTARNKVRATTWQGYETAVRLYLTPILGRVALTKLHAVHVEQLYAQMGRDGATVWTRRGAGVVLTIALRHAARQKLIPFNPAADVAKPRPADKEMLFLTEPQVRQFLAAARPARLYALFAVAVGSGMRQGELLGLAWPDVDFDRGTVAVQRSLAQVKGEFLVKEPKSKRSRRTIALPAFALDALRDHRAAMLKEGNIGAPLFCTRPGTYIGKSNLIRQVFQPILKRANAAVVEEAKKACEERTLVPPIRFHDLRHTHATGLLARGHSIKAVSQRLGHAGVELTLKVYAHVLPTDDAALAEGLHRMFG